MYNRENILDIINDFEVSIAKIEKEIETAESDTVRDALKHEFDSLDDNCYRYKMQARAWGLNPDSTEVEKVSEEKNWE